MQILASHPINYPDTKWEGQLHTAQIADGRIFIHNCTHIFELKFTSCKLLDEKNNVTLASINNTLVAGQVDWESTNDFL